ncbi:hypothetical protein DRF62_05245 [Chryseobacterium piscium]|uniref:Uncharacterized protein n=1 Tax=Chryseobacterium piscium TaxID=333702 RepID=A0A3D9BQM6_9FLAO|nr:hypothetical protein DRF62_05245 [Chryseobacterium piscium]
MFEVSIILFIILFAIGSVFYLINTEKRENHRIAYQTIFMIILLAVCWFTTVHSFNDKTRIISFSGRLANLGSSLLFPILLYIIHKLIPRKLKNDYFLYMLLFLISAYTVMFVSFLAVIAAAKTD